MPVPFPEHYLITPEPATYGRGASVTTLPDTDDINLSFQRFLLDLEASLSAGIKLVQLRSKLLTPTAFAALAKQAAVLCHRVDAKLIVNGALHVWKTDSDSDTDTDTDRSDTHIDADTALQAEIDALNADGVHLPSARLMHCSQRPLRVGQWVSAACHTASELQQAVALQLDFVTLSPVLATATHPGAEPLGWERFAALSHAAYAVNMPIFALGGMHASDVTIARAHGAHGIAAIRSLWENPLD